MLSTYVLTLLTFSDEEGFQKVSNTTTKQAFVPGHLSWQPLGPGQLVAFVPGPTASRASGGDRGLLSRLEAPTGAKGGTFVPVGGSNRDKRLRGPFVPVGTTNRDKRPPSPPLARLAVGPGTKATYCPGPKGCRDKWPGTKACFVVVRPYKG